MKSLRALAVAAFVVFSLAPVLWGLKASFETGSALFQVDYWPAHPSLDNYRAVFEAQPFGRNILNSFIVATASVAIALGLGTLAASALGRIAFRGRRLMLYAVLAITMFPQVAVLAGMFELIRALGLYDRPGGLVVSYVVITLPMTVWLLTGFMREVPAEIEAAARIDGAGAWTVLTRILVPLVRPGLVTAGLLAFIASWNEFLFALTFTLTDQARTVPVAIALLSGASRFELPWGQLMAASVVVTVPVVLIAAAFQRRVVAGLAAGAVKR